MATFFIFLLGVLTSVAFSETFRLVKKEIDRRAEIKRQWTLDRRAEIRGLWVALDGELAKVHAELRSMRSEVEALGHGVRDSAEMATLAKEYLEYSAPWTFGTDGSKFLETQRLKAAA